MPIVADAGEGGQQIAGMGDGRIGQHALHVLLAKGGEVADGHGEDGDDPEQRRPERTQIGEHFVDDAQKQCEGGGFGRGGKQRNNGRRRAFVDVGRPDVEGRGGDFEENADQHERQRGDDQGLVLRGGRQVRDLVDLRGSGSAEDERDAVEQECGGEGAEEEILDGGFRAAAGLLAVAGKDVGGDGRDFKRDEDDEQFDGAGEQAHADCAEDDERVELALMVAVCGQRVEREQQRDQNNPQMSTWKKTVKALVSTVRKSRFPEAARAARGWPRGRWWFRSQQPSRGCGAAMRAGARRRSA